MTEYERRLQIAFDEFEAEEFEWLLAREEEIHGTATDYDMTDDELWDAIEKQDEEDEDEDEKEWVRPRDENIMREFAGEFDWRWERR